MDGKRYYWLKLKDDFFDSKRIKKLRKIAGGDTYTIIYLKMQLLAMKQDGYIHYSGLESTFAEELALDLNENADDVQMTINYLVSVDLAEPSEDMADLFFPYSIENTGSETASALRSRKYRENQKVLQCNTDATDVQQLRHGEIEKEKELDIEIDKEKRKRFVPPTVEEVKCYCFERGNNIDPQEFVDWYASKNWFVGKNKMSDWKASVRTWESKSNNNKSSYNSKAQELEEFYEMGRRWASK